MRPKNERRENPAAEVGAEAEAVAVVVAAAAAGHAAGKLLTGGRRHPERHSPHFFELRDDVDRCRIAGF